jgi:hypothetical protein
MNKIKPSSTEFLLKFDDIEVSKEKCKFLKPRLDNFNLYIGREYSIRSDLQYNKFLELLSIGIAILTPKHLIPKDVETAIGIFMDHMGTFQNFYEAQCLIFNKSLSKASGC